ncbi:MAG: PAS domain-containing protein [Hyphomicrobiales bacterium]|nr:PAS domain-containing protein [Hyphomicrobiales bacterium]
MSAPKRDRGAETADGLLRALRNTNVSVFHQDLAMRVSWAHNVPASWNEGNIVGLVDSDFLPAESARIASAAKQAVLAGEPQQRFEIHVDRRSAREGEHWFDFWIDADVSDTGEIRGTVATAVEITEQKQREQTLRVLLREVSHRSRNLLAIIQGIANQTGRYSSNIDGFLLRFRGRLQSLASSQDLVTSSNWRGADLWELILGQATRYVPVPRRSIRIEGERLWLNPNAALHVGLAMHELIANSVSYGALSEPDAIVTVGAYQDRSPERPPALVLTWRELVDASHRGPDAAGMEKRFGSVALEKIVPASLNGTASLVLENGALEYRLVIPAGSFEAV